jgi:hypothetical protein
MGREISRRDFLNGVGIAVGPRCWQPIPHGCTLSAFRSLRSLRSRIPATIRPRRPACAAVTTVPGKLRTNCATAVAIPRDGQNRSTTMSRTIWSLSAAASVVWPRLTSTASLPDASPGFSSSTTTTISAGTPSATNFRQENDCCSDTAAPNPSKRRAITANRRLAFCGNWESTYSASTSITIRNCSAPCTYAKPCFLIKKHLAPTAWCPRKACTISASTLRWTMSRRYQSPKRPARILFACSMPSVDYMPDLTPEQKRAKLVKTSYKDFLLQYVKVHPDVVKVFQTSTHDLICRRN